MNLMKPQGKSAKPRCGLCGKTKNLMQTSCCGNWICNDHHKYVLFSYARNSCARNHDRYTLCSFHHQNGHKGHWKDCEVCRKSFQTEIYVWYGTNEYNFEVLENPPHFEPTHCDRCGVVIKLGTDGYSTGPRGTLCERCTDLDRGYEQPANAFKPVIPRKPRPQLPANENPAAIEIILSAKAQARWRLKPTVRASEPPAHWLGQWRVDFAQKADRSWVALVTNVVTLFTFVFPLKELKPDSFEKLFRLRLGFALTDASVLAKWKDAPLVFAHGNPRVAVGSMNGMKRELPWNTDREGFRQVDDEDWINETVFLSLTETYPRKAFAKRMAEAATHR
jgi:hypothetical protein